MELEFMLFVVLKKNGVEYFQAGIIKGSWFKGTSVPRKNDATNIVFCPYRTITKLAQVKNPKNFENMKTWLEMKRKSTQWEDEVKKDFLYNMVCKHLDIEKAFIHKTSSKISEYHPRKETTEPWRTQ